MYVVYPLSPRSVSLSIQNEIKTGITSRSTQRSLSAPPLSSPFLLEQRNVPCELEMPGLGMALYE